MGLMKFFMHSELSHPYSKHVQLLPVNASLDLIYRLIKLHQRSFNYIDEVVMDEEAKDGGTHSLLA